MQSVILPIFYDFFFASRVSNYDVMTSKLVFGN